MAKKKTTKTEPATQRMADALSEIEAVSQAIAEFEAAEAECVRQLEEANRVAAEWDRAVQDTRSLLNAQREKLAREYSRLHIEASTLERKQIPVDMNKVQYNAGRSPFD